MATEVTPPACVSLRGGPGAWVGQSRIVPSAALIASSFPSGLKASWRAGLVLMVRWRWRSRASGELGTTGVGEEQAERVAAMAQERSVRRLKNPLPGGERAG